MRRLMLLVVTQLLLSGALAPNQAVGAVPATPSLPAIGANGRTLPLTVDQLSPEEGARFATLPPGGDLARRFLYTRGFLRYCRLVVDGKLPAADLPPLPAEENWDRRFFSEDEASNVVDVALQMNLITLFKPAVGDEVETVPLTVDQLTPEERATFAALAPGGDPARRFLYTRAYLRHCRLVVDGKLPPLSLPRLPAEENWDRQFLSEDEASNVVDVALGMKLVAMMRPPVKPAAN